MPCDASMTGQAVASQAQSEPSAGLKAFLSVAGTEQTIHVDTYTLYMYTCTTCTLCILLFQCSQQGRTTFKPIPGTSREGRAHARACVPVVGIARACFTLSTFCNWKVTPLTSSLTVMIIEATGNAFSFPLQAHGHSLLALQHALLEACCHEDVHIWKRASHATCTKYKFKTTEYPLPGRLPVHLQRISTSYCYGDV